MSNVRSLGLLRCSGLRLCLCAPSLLRSLLTPAKRAVQVAGGSGVKIGSTCTVSWAARPLAVGSPPVPLVALWARPRPPLLSAGRPRKGRSRSCLRAASTVQVLPPCLTSARVRATHGPAVYRSAELGTGVRRLVRPREWRLSAPAARMQVMRSQASNLSIERTPKSQLRCLSVAAHVER